MACYLPDHLVRCLICKNLFSDARRLRCSCVYCYSCCLKLIKDLTIYCQCSAIHRFNSQEDLEKALVIDTVVNDLVHQHRKQNQIKLVDYEIASLSEYDHHHHQQQSSQHLNSSSRKQLAVVQPPCSICQKKTNLIILCEHCQTDICEFCLDKHYLEIRNSLENKWKQCQEKFQTINQHVFLSHQNKANAIVQLDSMKQTIDQRTSNLKLMIDEHRQILTKHIDNYVTNLEQIVKVNHVDLKYQSIRERLPRILEEEMNTSNLLAFLDEIEGVLQDFIYRDKQLKDLEIKIPYVSQPDSLSFNLSQLIGELKFDDQPSSFLTTKLSVNTNLPIASNDTNISPLMSLVVDRNHTANRRMRAPLRARNGRGIQHLSQIIGSSPRNNSNNYYYRGRRGYPYRGRVSSRQRPPPLNPSTDHQFDIVPNNHYQWSIDFKEIPYFLSVLDNRNRARQSSTPHHHKHDYMLFIADDYGQLTVYNLPKSMSNIKPTRIGTNELFPKNSRLLMESLTVYEYAIVVYVRRFEQRTNEIEHSKLIKAGLPIMKGEQGRCNDHGGMIYLFSHNGEEIDGVYQSHPIRMLLADQIYGRLWALNPMENHLYSYMLPNSKNEIRKCLQDEEILLEFANEQFEPTTMFQSNQSIGFIDSEHDLYRLYKKDDQFRLITTYENSQNSKWKLTTGVIFKDNRSLLKLTEEKFLNDRFEKINSDKNARRCLIELTANGEEKRRIQADTLYSMTLGPDDEVILGFAVRGDHGLIHCY